jgi:hypothetical protein
MLYLLAIIGVLTLLYLIYGLGESVGFSRGYRDGRKTGWHLGQQEAEMGRHTYEPMP